MKRLIFSLIISLLGSLALHASHRYELYEVFVAPTDGRWTLNVGENASFEITLLHNNVPDSNFEINYEISEDMMPARHNGTVKLKNGRAVVKAGTMKSPGFIRCKAWLKVGKYDYRSSATIGFNPEKLAPVTEYPSDFLDFWNENIKWARNCDLTPRMTLLPEKCTDKVNAYMISFATEHINKRIYGMLSIPKEKGTYPAIVMYPGAGVYPINPEYGMAERGVIVLSIGIHGIPVNMAKEVYNNLDWGALQSYHTHNVNNKDRYYYRRVIQGAVRAIDFVKQLPECNGVIGTFGGSQGGYLSIAAASLHTDVKALVAFFPAMSDLAGYLHGRAGGWPHMLNKKEYRTNDVINTLKYYDTANFARNIRVKGFYAFGYNDEVCPPTTTYSVYNTISAPKELIPAPTAEHYTFTEQYRDAVDWIINELNNQP